MNGLIVSTICQPLMTPRISFELWTGKTLADKTHPIVLRVYYNGKRKIISLSNYSITQKVLSAKKTQWKDGRYRNDVRNKILDDINLKVLSYLKEHDICLSYQSQELL
jgi:hypothetical protein